MRSWTSTPVPTLPPQPGGAPLMVRDSSTGELVASHPEEGRARLYVCGITPYDATHMGHAATYLLFDLIGRIWRDAGLEVGYVQNVTDVDEPLLERAERDGVHWEDLADQEIDLFREDMEALRILPPDAYIGAVEGIPSDVAAIETLLASGAAYEVAVPEGTAMVEGARTVDVYLDLGSQESFGHVSGWTREQMMEVFAERGGDPEREGKRDALDPLLWRAGREGEPHWDGASLGVGRPGWHIECSTIALDHLGSGFDIQGGGTDLIFPHHEMSAVQAEAVTGERFAQVYVHQAMVGLDGEKMSKSKGNLVLVSRLRRAGVDPMAIRLALLSKHYATPWEWTAGQLEEAEARLARWREAARVEEGGVGGADVLSDASEAPDASVISLMRERLRDDVDAPGALAAVDAWADRVLADAGAGAPGASDDGPGTADASASAASGPLDPAPTGLVPQAVDALLGVRL